MQAEEAEAIRKMSAEKICMVGACKPGMLYGKMFLLKYSEAQK